ncbi:HpcH/HpaI aldolase family protein [Halococcus saccharolyticus]|uniref:4-hydroxy-2-oxovalerate aldolase n=1 Tax=Halococcus saccharolyticus DSM 5350 TaxID=1227455 RepID=M0MI31_9EURY|nr:aldolase/citrate lyase family protein [Halococcus saccharolyticus]EMA44075.1 4-hydroxy-2-oxovalerate aldolase [Halococcus saccharolyticus DSM 5350]
MDPTADMAAFRQAVRSGEPVVGGWVSIGHPAVAEITGAAGYDFVTIDTEHAANSIETVENLVRAVDAAGDAIPIVRPPTADPVAIKRLLDTGVGGIMVPRVDSAETAASVVEATRYPPAGVRGTAASRASGYGRTFPTYLEWADDALTRIIQIETEAAVAAAGDIAGVEGVDALFVGPTDLSAALDVHLDFEADDFRAAVGTVIDAAADENVPVGVFATDPDRIDDWLAMGFDFAIVGFDATFLVERNETMRSAFERAAATDDGT